jgi:predicted anti-sigma-YlaC factor YlaD
VLAPTQGIPAGALAGEYVGASGDIGLGVGVGANVLLGVSGRTFALQPLSLEGSIAVNIALGVSMLKLRAV